MKIKRVTVDLSTYPDLVVVYLGMPVRTLVGLKTLLGFGPKIAKSAADQPDRSTKPPCTRTTFRTPSCLFVGVI